MIRPEPVRSDWISVLSSPSIASSRWSIVAVGLGDVADILARLRRGLFARGLRLALGLGPELAGILVGLALDLRRARLGRLDDRAHLVAGRRGERLGALARRALELLELVRERAQVGIDRVRVVTPAADWEVLLLDALSFQGHASQPPSQ